MELNLQTENLTRMELNTQSLNEKSDSNHSLQNSENTQQKKSKSRSRIYGNYFDEQGNFFAFHKFMNL